MAGAVAVTPSGPRPRRVVSLDLARGLGIVAMVFGHTLDALLSPAARMDPVAMGYWKIRGLTAPRFMMVSGWAVILAVSRLPAKGLQLIRARLPRIALLLALGYALRLPGWNTRALLSGDPTVWQHFLAFDALHLIAVGLLGAVLILALPWSAPRQGLAFVLLATVALALGMRTPSRPPIALPALALAQAVGGTSPFPVFPWVAYFFFGAAVPLLAKSVRVRCAVGLAGVAVFLAASCWWRGFGDMSPAHPVLVWFRAGAVLLILTALEAVPACAAAAIAPLARSSLTVYVFHVPIVYGWFTFEGFAQRVGPRLPFHAAALVALTILACAIALDRMVKLVTREVAAVARIGRDALVQADSPCGSVERGQGIAPSARRHLTMATLRRGEGCASPRRAP
ncbi:MAG TPA: heparan-alpha-glucosaminide N-acetyltransferase domain-containing protein [Anaeromyxobacteraceae bacterium]|nr:heparan-alpha-glucosaminide N-acetyltransferase domain-containing protein [Anaeromyxobacteraceae bacterium]